MARRHHAATAPDGEPGAASRRRARWIAPALLVVAWLIIGGVGGPYAGKLGEVATNDDTAFLPASAEATEVAELQRAFDTGGGPPAVIVAERPGGLTGADLDYLARRTGDISGLDGVTAEPSPPVPSDDGEAAQIVVRVAGDPGEVVGRIRATLAEPPEGLTVLVTGPAGQIADLGEAFTGIDGVLLLVTAAVVALILIAVYRSPLLPLLVLASCAFALALASAAVYLLTDAGVLDLNGQSQGILSILVFGAATDYALFLVARFREELRDADDRFTAVRRARRATLEPIAASAGTVVLGVLCLLASDLNSNRTLGPVAAIGIVAALLASVTFLPAALALTGRAAFWPRRPAYGSGHEPSRLWRRVAALIGRRPRATWILTAFVLLIAVAFAPRLEADGTAESDVFLTDVDSVAGRELVSAHFPGGTGAPTVIIADADHLDAVAAAADVDGVARVETSPRPGAPPAIVDGRVLISVVLDDPGGSEAALDTVGRLRIAVHAVEGADAKVGGPTATRLDTLATSERDRTVIIPLVLAVIFIVLALLLRAIVAPLVLIATVVLSFGATMGVSALVFNELLGFPGADPVVPLFGFVFLVALGIDYNIFLMTRVREESRSHGTREGTRRGLAVTGGVITSAGVVLAATFSALAVLPLLFMAQIAFIVAFGVLLDTLIVRSLLVPALTVDIGRRIWWPSRLARRTGAENGRADRSAGPAA